MRDRPYWGQFIARTGSSAGERHDHPANRRGGATGSALRRPGARVPATAVAGTGQARAAIAGAALRLALGDAAAPLAERRHAVAVRGQRGAPRPDPGEPGAARPAR